MGYGNGGAEAGHIATATAKGRSMPAGCSQQEQQPECQAKEKPVDVIPIDATHSLPPDASAFAPFPAQSGYTYKAQQKPKTRASSQPLGLAALPLPLDIAGVSRLRPQAPPRLPGALIGPNPPRVSPTAT